MGVVVRQKLKGAHNPWWVFIAYKNQRESRKIGDKCAAKKIASGIRVKLNRGEYVFKLNKKKKCFRCGEKKDLFLFDTYYNTLKGGECKERRNGVCRACVLENQKFFDRKKRHEERVNEIFDLLKWFKANNRRRLERQNLSDNYVKMVITSSSKNINFGDLPSWVVQLKKLHLELIRLRKEKRS